MDKVSFNGFLMAMGLVLIIISPLIIALYAALTASWGIMGVVLATMGTYMVINFYGAKDPHEVSAKDKAKGKTQYRTLGLLFGPLLVIIGLYLMVKF